MQSVHTSPTPTPTPTPTVIDSPCMSDEDCPGDGFICDEETGLCIEGCTEVQLCPTGEVCVDIVDGIGMCAVPTPTPTPTDLHGDSNGGCTIIGSAQAGIAFINILIPLLPAFAIGLRMIRRGKKNTI